MGQVCRLRVGPLVSPCWFGAGVEGQAPPGPHLSPLPDQPQSSPPASRSFPPAQRGRLRIPEFQLDLLWSLPCPCGQTDSLRPLCSLAPLSHLESPPQPPGPSPNLPQSASTLPPGSPLGVGPPLGISRALVTRQSREPESWNGPRDPPNLPTSRVRKQVQRGARAEGSQTNKVAQASVLSPRPRGQARPSHEE